MMSWDSMGGVHQYEVDVANARSGYARELIKEINWDDHRSTRQCTCGSRRHYYHLEYNMKVSF